MHTGRREPYRLKKLPSHRIFALRLARGVGLSVVVLGISLGSGVIGYRYVAGLEWIDALLNASMILTGMGPVDQMQSVAAKLFASLYALFSGVAFITAIGLFFAPAFHRFLHTFHLELVED